MVPCLTFVTRPSRRNPSLLLLGSIHEYFVFRVHQLGPMNDVHLAPHVGVNGTSAAHGQFRKIAPPPPPQPQLQLHPRPPLQAQPPRDAIFANSASASRVGGANVSGSAAPSSRERTHASLGRGGSEGGGGSGVGKGGGIECRYGVACSRIECSYRHPKGEGCCPLGL